MSLVRFDPSSHPPAVFKLVAQLAALDAALLAEGRASRPDLARIRSLRQEMAAVRARIAKLREDPPPHTD